ncbi:MAG: GatB/YqeY domain-containing protein [Patescibacteria group bacterium]|jgi:uncharacterized protein YqeY|nr:GatB/YqeY domain-containing protein [Patescibacteria group bacterium]
MGIIEQIENDYNQSFKAKNELAVLTLRQLKTALTNAEIANSRQPLTDDQIIKVLRSELKKRKEAAELYQQGGRDDLAQKENQETKIISNYLPPELDLAEITKKVQEVITQVGAQGPQDVGKVMGIAMKALGNQADGNVVKQVVSDQLKK